MHTEKLHDVGYEVLQEYKAYEIPDKFSSVVSALNKVVAHTETSPNQQQSQGQQAEGGSSGPSREQLEREFEVAIEELFSSLEKVQSNQFVPSQIAILRKIDGWKWTGRRLRHRIEGVLESGPTGQEETRDRIRDLFQDFREFHRTLDRLVGALGDLGIDREHMSADEAEVGALFPLETGDTSLRELNDELHRLDLFISVFSEVTGEPGVSYDVRALSSGSIEIFLGAALPAAWLISKVVREVTEIVNNIMEIRAKHRGLEELDFYEELQEQQIQEYIDDQIGELRDEVMDVYEENAEGEEGRSNVVSTHVKKALEYILDQVDRGATFEVKVFAPTRETDEEDVDVEGFTSFQDFKEAGASMKNLRTGEERILFLEPPELLEPPVDEGDGAANGEGTDRGPLDDETEETADDTSDRSDAADAATEEDEARGDEAQPPEAERPGDDA